MGLIFIARHSQQPLLPLTAYCCENMKRREINCDADAVLNKRPILDQKRCTFNSPFFFLLFFLAFREYTKNINYKLNCVYATKTVFKLVIIIHMSM